MKHAPKKPNQKQKAATSKAKREKKLAKAPRAPESKDVVALAHPGGPIRYDVDTLPHHQSKAVERAMERHIARRPRIAVKVDQNSHVVLRIGPDFGGTDSHHFRKLDAFGTPSKAFVDNAIGWLAAIACRHGRGKPTEQELNAVLAAVDGIGPNNEAEAMLAVQMAGCHQAAMKMLARTNQADTDEAVQNYSSAAVKLMRTYTTQLEALAKLRRGGEQKVRVEHVHVHPGGQAIVGHVTTGGTGEGKLGNRHQPHEADAGAAVFAPGSPVWSDNPERYAMSEGGPEGEDQV
jgi:organic hydroperoxide reductase OsmC/OhrA